MQNKKIKLKVKFNIPLEYVTGHLRYGHKEGVLELTAEEFNRLKEDPEEFVYEEDILENLNLVIDDYSVEDYGGIDSIEYEVINDAE